MVEATVRKDDWVARHDLRMLYDVVGYTYNVHE